MWSPGRSRPSRIDTSVSSSSHGRPIIPRNTEDGNSSASSAVKSHEPRSMNASMKWFTRSVMSVFKRVDPARCEEGIEQLSVAHVVGWVDVQRDQRQRVALLDEILRREQSRVAQHFVDERTGADHHRVADPGRALLQQSAVRGLRSFRRAQSTEGGDEVDEVELRHRALRSFHVPPELVVSFSTLTLR